MKWSVLTLLSACFLFSCMETVDRKVDLITNEKVQENSEQFDAGPTTIEMTVSNNNRKLGKNGKKVPDYSGSLTYEAYNDDITRGSITITGNKSNNFAQEAVNQEFLSDIAEEPMQIDYDRDLITMTRNGKTRTFKAKKSYNAFLTMVDAAKSDIKNKSRKKNKKPILANMTHEEIMNYFKEAGYEIKIISDELIEINRSKNMLGTSKKVKMEYVYNIKSGETERSTIYKDGVKSYETKLDDSGQNEIYTSYKKTGNVSYTKPRKTKSK